MKSCPQCHLMLEEATWHESTLSVCRSCGGVWIPEGYRETVLADGRAELKDLATLSPNAMPSPLWDGMVLYCPICPATQMERRESPDIPGHPLIVCPKCSGTWLLTNDRDALLTTTETVTTISEPAPAAPEPVAPAEPAAPVCEAAVEASPTAPEVPLPTQAPAPQAVPVTEPPAAIPTPTEPAAAEPKDRAEAALQRLLEGNRRFAEGRTTHRSASPADRETLAAGQHPFAMVIGCIDSRVSPEIVLDQGLGDILVIRTAGEVLDETLNAGIQLATDVYDIPLIAVVGHSGCGAVTEAAHRDPARGYAYQVFHGIHPAIEAVRMQVGDTVELTAREQARRVAANVRTLTPVVDQRHRAGTTRVVALFYDLATGRVEVIDTETVPPPESTPAPEMFAIPSPTVPGDVVSAFPSEASISPEKPGAESAATAPGFTLPMPSTPVLEPTSSADTPMPPAKVENALVVCPRCLSQLMPGDKCPICHVTGVPFDKPIKCPRCGAANALAASVCRGCGTRLRTPSMLDRLYPAVAQETPPIAAPQPQEPAAFRWCPQCRRHYDPRQSFCQSCGISLVEPWFRVPCPSCGTIAPIALASCPRCHADFHQGGQGATPPELPSDPMRFGRLRRSTFTTTSDLSSCSSQVFLLAIVAAILLFAWPASAALVARILP